MSEPRITRQRRLFVDAISQHPQTTFSELKKLLVGKWPEHMDLATLYRIVDTFKAQNLIHEMNIANERVLFPCKADHTGDHDAITLIFCENCGAIYDEHETLAQNYTQSETHARVKSCAACVIR